MTQTIAVSVTSTAAKATKARNEDVSADPAHSDPPTLPRDGHSQRRVCRVGRERGKRFLPAALRTATVGDRFFVSRRTNLSDFRRSGRSPGTSSRHHHGTASEPDHRQTRDPRRRRRRPSRRRGGGAGPGRAGPRRGRARIARAISATAYKGKAQAFLDVVAPTGVDLDRVLLAGTGAAADITAESMLKLGGAVMGKIKETKARR